MTAPREPAGDEGRSAPPWYRLTGQRLTILVIVAMSLFGIVGVAWGTFHPKQVAVEYLDAGPESRFAIGKIVAFPEQNVYVIGLENGQLRAIDGVVRYSECIVEYRPQDVRGAERNPRGEPGVYVDPCSGSVWAATGDVLSGADRPLRTFTVTGQTAPDGSKRVEVEVIGDRHPTPTPNR
jgi:hypothetical protein